MNQTQTTTQTRASLMKAIAAGRQIVNPANASGVINPGSVAGIYYGQVATAPGQTQTQPYEWSVQFGGQPPAGFICLTQEDARPRKDEEIADMIIDSWKTLSDRLEQGRSSSTQTASKREPALA